MIFKPFVLFVSFVFKMDRNKMIIALGDILSILITTLIGFATHDELNSEFLPRIFATLIPLIIAWFLLAPWFGLFQSENVSDPKQLWRPVFAMIFAAPLAGVFRGLILQADIVPIFIIVFGSTSAFGMVIWRTLYFVFNRKPWAG